MAKVRKVVQLYNIFRQKMFIGIWKWKLSTLNSPLSKEYFHSIDTENADITHLACILGFESCFFIIASFDFVRVNLRWVSLGFADHAPVLRTDKRCSLSLECFAFHYRGILCWSTWLLVPTRAECQVRLIYAEQALHSLARNLSQKNTTLRAWRFFSGTCSVLA